MKIYLSKINESWIVDRIRKEWYKNNKDISTKFINDSDILWIISPWLWKKVPKKHLINKKVICSHYHFDFENFDQNDFYDLDKYVDEYHVISEKTKEQLITLTNKKITSIPFWVNQDMFYRINQSGNLKKEYGFKETDYLVGSFQRDTESKDLISPKLIKGPDIFFELIQQMFINNKNLVVVLTGKRRNYLINKFNENGIPYKYFEMIDISKLNQLYNILDLYIVSSRIEGGPQAIMECSVSKTPILSTDVGIASEILSPESIYSIKNFKNARPDVDYAYKEAQKFTIPNGMNLFRDMFIEFYEN
tara:strand:- start:50744 stop:51658 length:915 start_codon:yes stop_codon:yes gene_type:complete